jgi:hypothetical protein
MADAGGARLDGAVSWARRLDPEPRGERRGVRLAAWAGKCTGGERIGRRCGIGQGDAMGPKKGPPVDARGQWFCRQNIVGAEPSGGDVALPSF